MRWRPRVSPPNPVATLSRTLRGVFCSIQGGMKVLRSAPAQKASPDPVKIATSRLSSSRKTSHVCQSNSCVSGSTAFFASGRLMVTYAIRPRFSYRTFGTRALGGRHRLRWLIAIQLAPCDRELVHLVWAIRDPQRARGRVHGGEWEVVAHAPASVHLDRTVDHLRRHLGCGDLDRRDLDPRALVADGVHQPGGLQHKQAHLLDLDPRLGDPVPNDALARKRLPERRARVGALAHQVEGPLGHPDH